MSGPFIVSTKRANSHVPYAWDRQPLDSLVVIARRAVATLEEARAEATAICAAHGWPDTLVGECALPEIPVDLLREAFTRSGLTQAEVARRAEAGGTVGPLPDGTVIEVERTSWYRLAIAADLLPKWQQGADTPHVGKVKAEIIRAFNARVQS